jgi:hypothetical protein
MLLVRHVVKLLALTSICLVLQIVPASADTLTLQVDASLIAGVESGLFTQFQPPTVFVSGQIFLDLTTAFGPVPPGPPPNGVLGVNLLFTGPNGSFQETTSGTGFCEEVGSSPGLFTCFLNAPGFSFQTNAFLLPLAVGSTFGACATRFTQYPDGVIAMGSGVCGETSSVSFLGNSGIVYTLENGSSSGTFTVTAISTPEPSTLPLLATGLAALVVLALLRRTATRCGIA